MIQIQRSDIKLINDLSSRTYTGLSLKSNSTDLERESFQSIKQKLKEIASYFSLKYGELYGSFEVNASPEANPMTRGNTLNVVWSTFFKGATNKQYAAQISFVIERLKPHLNLGFYFGRASTHSLKEETKAELTNRLLLLGNELANSIENNPDLLRKYNSLFDYGFTAYINEAPVLPQDWIDAIKHTPQNCQITAKLLPNDLDVIENSTIDAYVSHIIFLMSAIRGIEDEVITPFVKPMTPEQRAKQAERLAEIGNKGELFIMEFERIKLKELGTDNAKYPKHVALESSSYGYDILSIDENKKELFIEVKSTTRQRDDYGAKRFFLSTHEFDVYKENDSQYKLYRVYNVENEPILEILDFKDIKKESDGYICTY